MDAFERRFLAFAKAIIFPTLTDIAVQAARSMAVLVATGVVLPEHIVAGHVAAEEARKELEEELEMIFRSLLDGKADDKASTKADANGNAEAGD